MPRRPGCGRGGRAFAAERETMTVLRQTLCTGRCRECGRCSGGLMLDELSRKKAAEPFETGRFAFEPGAPGLGFAVDLGTTTVAAALFDLAGGERLWTGAETNPQTESGADVISRIAWCEEDPSRRKRMRDKITGLVASMAEEAVFSAGRQPEELREGITAGNTAMAHFFAGRDPSGLARAPFTPAFTGPLTLRGTDLGFQGRLEQIRFRLVPAIGGHVGGDVTAGLLAADADRRAGNSLFIDIGTNGEMVLAAGGRLLACSAAAGPAFEGAALSCGMRAAAGAVEQVRITGAGVFVKTVGNRIPAGICGSGAVDAAAAMLKAGLMDETGRLDPSLESEDAGERALSLGERVFLTQKDVRALQLAKGAIWAGIGILLKTAGISVSELDRVVMAGAFGSCIDPESAAAIGLLPPVPREKIRAAGNAAGTGAAMCLLSGGAFQRACRLAETAKHIELADCGCFQEEFLKGMSFPRQDSFFTER